MLTLGESYANNLHASGNKIFASKKKRKYVIFLESNFMIDEAFTFNR
jgi:hypothetical protein